MLSTSTDAVRCACTAGPQDSRGVAGRTEKGHVKRIPRRPRKLPRPHTPTLFAAHAQRGYVSEPAVSLASSEARTRYNHGTCRHGSSRPPILVVITLYDGATPVGPTAICSPCVQKKKKKKKGAIRALMARACLASKGPPENVVDWGGFRRLLGCRRLLHSPTPEKVPGHLVHQVPEELVGVLLFVAVSFRFGFVSVRVGSVAVWFCCAIELTHRPPKQKTQTTGRARRVARKVPAPPPPPPSC